MKRKLTAGCVAMNAFLWLVLIIMIVPFLWLIVSSFRPNMELFSEPFAIPRTLSLSNYTAVLSSHPMFLYLVQHSICDCRLQQSWT